MDSTTPIAAVVVIGNKDFACDENSVSNDNRFNTSYVYMIVDGYVRSNLYERPGGGSAA